MHKSNTSELALETLIQKALTGHDINEINTDTTSGKVFDCREQYLTGNRYYVGDPQDFNMEYAVDETRLWHFIETTQPEEFCKLQRTTNSRAKFISLLDRKIKKYGILHLLKTGIEIEDASFVLFYVPPVASSSHEVDKRFESNEFSVTRQVRYNCDKPLQEIDMVIFLNGLPISTIELKNTWTGQTAKVHGIRQYKQDRDYRQPLLQFGRCLVHFTMDTDEVYMTTHLRGVDTFFLPFNKGCNHSKGNPHNPDGHKTTYMWEDILTRQSLANIIQHFIRLGGDKKEALEKRTLFFPRYHQLEVVKLLLSDVATNGVGKTYLIQHSAGSGKSNSITWAAYQLIEAYHKGETVKPLFDSVVVVTDRKILDKQISKNIDNFSEVKRIVAHADSSADLKNHLESGKRIIITTIQKFPFIVNGIADLSNKNFAVIIDEAHSSQSGRAADNMNKSIGAKSETEDPDEFDWQDAILEAIRGRKMSSNASYIAFTATPKKDTFERFGILQSDGKYKPFHLYSMKQAIEEGFILDVLANYTTYRSYYEIEKSIEDNPLFDTSRAQKRLRAHVERNPDTIKLKAEIMLDHFINQVVKRKKLKGKAKAIIATQNIECAIEYYFAVKNLLESIGNPFKVIIAFSGKKKFKGVEYTEDILNGFPSKEINDYFDTDDYRILVVANKFLTGFDQPKLTAMYIDKKLKDVLAVQAISRLNRSAPKYGKKTEDLFVLDFFNNVDDIKKSFDPFYTATSLSSATDIGVLDNLRDDLSNTDVYSWGEVELFNQKYFTNSDASELSPIIDKVANRFNEELELNDNEKADFKIKAKQFVKIYGQIAAIIPNEIIRWEMLFWFLKFLIPKLKIRDAEKDDLDALLNSIDLSTYGLERVKLNTSIELDSSESELDPQNPNSRGAHSGDEDKDPLDLIIKSFNERYFQGWDATPEEQRVKFVNIAKHIQAHPDFKSKILDNSDSQTKELAFAKIFDDVINKQRKNELDLYRLMTQDAGFKQAMQDTIKRILGA